MIDDTNGLAGFDPANWPKPASQSLLNAAALGLTVAAWRNGPIEKVHVHHITDSEMMRLNAAITRFLRDRLAACPPPGTQRVWTIDSMALLVLLVLPDGKRLWEIAGEEYEDVLKQVEKHLVEFPLSLVGQGRERAMARLVEIGELYA